MKSTWYVAACAIALTLAGCGHHSGGGSGDATTHALNAVVDAEPLDIYVDDNSKITGLAAGSTSANFAPGLGTRKFTIKSSTTGSVLAEKSFSLVNNNQALVIFGRRSAISLLVMSEDVSAPSSGKAKVRALNLSPEAPSVDVYVTTTDVASTSPSLSGVAYGGATDYLEVTGGSSTLAYTTSGAKDIRFQATGQNFAAGSSYTLVVFPSAGGQLVNGAILTNGGSGVFLANTQSRVKAVNSMADSSGVTFKADGTTLLSNVPFTASSSYVTLATGNHVLTTEASNVPGVTMASVSQNLAPARDYSMVAVGSAAAPGVIALADENYAPAANTARVRFVHAAVGQGAVDVLVNFASQATNVTYGNASAYFALAPSLTYTITFANPGGVGNLATLSNLEIDASNVYTVYLLGSAAAPKAVLVRDR